MDIKFIDWKMILFYFIVLIVKEKYLDLVNFWYELYFVEKVVVVFLENVLLDVKELGWGMELIWCECSIYDNSVFWNFFSINEGKLDKF